MATDLDMGLDGHTPGPWSVSKGSAYYVCCDGSWIASAMGIRGPEGEANARLIAAAPELLAALEAFVDGFDPDKEYDATDTAYVVFGEKAKLARAAIAKAKVPSRA